MATAPQLASSEFVRRERRAAVERGFTLLELVVAGIIAVIVVGALTLSMTQLSRSRSATQKRLEAHLRASSALDSLRRDIASTLRSDDLLQTRLLILDQTQSSRIGDIDRDELLIFSSRLAPVRPNKYQGEGDEYETQYRVTDDELGAALWQRRDPVPDHTPDGGGVALPIADGIVSVNFEAYDGESWYPDWDSDVYGLPWAVRATVSSVGQDNAEDPYSDMRNLVTLRTVIALDRIVPPRVEEASADDKIEEAMASAEEALANGGVAPGDAAAAVEDARGGATGGRGGARGGGGADGGPGAGGGPGGGGGGPPGMSSSPARGGRANQIGRGGVSGARGGFGTRGSSGGGGGGGPH